MGFECTVAGRFIRGIILSFLPPSASPGRNTSEEEANIDLLLVKLTATYNQEIKRNDRWPLRQSLIQLSLPLLTERDPRRYFDFLHLHIRLAFPSPLSEQLFRKRRESGGKGAASRCAA